MPLFKSEKSIAIAQLLIAAILWGGSFTWVKWALEGFSTTQLLFWRFVLGFLLGEICLFIFKTQEYKNSHTDIKLAKYTGLFLALTLLSQIHGLNFTTATNSSFITTTYVVMIPFISFIIFRNKIKFRDVSLALLAMSGMSLLLNLQETGSQFLNTLNKGDFLTLFSAFFGALHIIFVSRFASNCKSAFRFNTYQNFWSALVLLPFLLFEMSKLNLNFYPTSPSIKSILGLSLLVVFVTMIAFLLQITAQKKLSTSTSSMLCLLEAPFAFIFAYFLLNETINMFQTIGALIILVSAFLAAYLEDSKKIPIIS